MEKIVNKYLDGSFNYSSLFDAYIRIRKELKRLGYTEETAAKVSNMTVELFKAHDEFNYYSHMLKKELSDMFNLEENDLNLIIHKRLEKINKLFPLNDGN
jgi:hypothetical protein